MVRVETVALAVKIAVVVADGGVGLRPEKQVQARNHQAVDVRDNRSYHGQVQGLQYGLLQAEEGQLEKEWNDECLRVVSALIPVDMVFGQYSHWR